MKIVTMGEFLLRLSTEGKRRFVQSNSFEVVYGGGEANVAISCANFGHDAYFVSKLPTHEIGQSAVDALREFGVNTQFIARGGDRVGIYFLESGASMRPSQVIYDRAHSSYCDACKEDFDFDKIMEGADWFHWSGISPALSSESADIARAACEAAKRHGATISLDFNFRSKLWSREQARETMLPLMKYIDVCICGKDDAYDCLGVSRELTSFHDIFRELVERYNFKYIVSTARESYSASHNGWSAVIYNGEELYSSKRYDIYPIVDRVGGGDSFASGIIHGLLTKPNQAEALEFAVAASALKHTIGGDANHVSIAEVEALVGGDASGRVQR